MYTFTVDWSRKTPGGDNHEWLKPVYYRLEFAYIDKSSGY